MLFNSNFRPFMIKKWENIKKKIIHNNVAKISFDLLIYLASPVKWSLQGIWSPSPLPMLTVFPVTLTLQEISLSPRRKNEIVFANRPVFLFDQCTTIVSFFLTATVKFIF